MLPKLHVIICSTRPGRIGLPIARWFHEFAKQHGNFDIELIDLADFKLPIYDEPIHPAAQDYKHEHTKKWSASVAAADAYIFVTPEYNYSPPPSLVNALDFVYREWNYKPCGFVSYGGVSGGLRSVQAVKMQITTLKMMPMMEGVMVPMAASMINSEGQFQSNALIDKSAVTLLEELRFWADGLKAMREKKPH
ncbi:NAD(P)H-dependent oxidoreductase [Alcaligenaceae bacterium]|nr:NAD(P)H-dependent oxidoreductase [Alcaligenaceae bacterium]